MQIRRLSALMGIAWFDDEAPPMDAPALRAGGLPLMPEAAAWPVCPRCGAPPLFRAQIPLNLTSLVAPDDARLVSVFECHASLDDGRPCDGVVVQLVSGDDPLRPLGAPESRSFDVALLRAGPSPDSVLRLLGRLMDRGAPLLRTTLVTPITIIKGVPRSIAEQAMESLHTVGATCALVETPPTLLKEVLGGRLVPFDDGTPGASKTTLPPIGEIAEERASGRMLGLLGGAGLSYRDHTFRCSCGANSRTAVRLTAQPGDTEGGLALGPLVVQVCLRCSSGGAYRSNPA